MRSRLVIKGNETLPVTTTAAAAAAVAVSPSSIHLFKFHFHLQTTDFHSISRNSIFLHSLFLIVCNQNYLFEEYLILKNRFIKIEKKKQQNIIESAQP